MQLIANQLEVDIANKLNHKHYKTICKGQLVAQYHKITQNIYVLIVLTY